MSSSGSSKQQQQQQTAAAAAAVAAVAAVADRRRRRRPPRTRVNVRMDHMGVNVSLNACVDACACRMHRPRARISTTALGENQCTLICAIY